MWEELLVNGVVREGSFMHVESSAAGAFAALRFGKSVLVFQMRVPFHEVKNQFMFVSHLKSHMVVAGVQRFLLGFSGR